MTKLSIVYLHVGADKTGSTTIQKFLDSNRQVLNKHGYCYPSSMTGSLDSISSTYSHHLVAAHFSHNLLDLDHYKARTSQYDEHAEREVASRYVKFMSRELREGAYKALILSYEGFNALKPDELRALKAYLLSIAEEVRVIYYLRPRFSYGQSALSERISFGMPAWKYHPPVNHYRERLLALESVFGKENMLVRRFSKDDFRNGDLISDFCCGVGLGHDFLEQATPVKASNESLSEHAIRVGDAMVFLLNGVDGPTGVEFNKLFFDDLNRLDGRRYRFNELQSNIILRATEEDSLFVRDHYGIELNDMPDQCDDVCPVISNESAESIARGLIQFKLPDLPLTDEKYAPVAGQSIQSAQGCLKYLGYQLFEVDGQQQMTVTVRVENNSDDVWGGDLVPVNLGYRWINKQSKEVDVKFVRIPLSDGRIAAGETKELAMTVLLPEQDGDYRLRLTMVQEFCSWFDDIGFKAQVLDVQLSGGKVADVSPPCVMFSIITVVLNDPEGLSRTASSIDQQVSENYEWIIIDGGSTDDTLASIEQMVLNKPVVLSGKDAGIYDAMNKGVNLSGGDYLVFMNAGDSFADCFVVEALEHCLSANVVDVLLGGTYQHINNCIFYRKPKHISWIVHGLPAFHQSTVYRADLLRKRNYNLAYSLLSDYEWLANQCIDGLTVGYLNRPISNFFVGGASYTNIRLKFKDSYNVKSFILKESSAWSLISSIHAIGKTVFVMAFLYKFCSIAKRHPASEKCVSDAVNLSTEYYRHQERSR